MVVSRGLLRPFGLCAEQSQKMYSLSWRMADDVGSPQLVSISLSDQSFFDVGFSFAWTASQRIRGGAGVLLESGPSGFQSSLSARLWQVSSDWASSHVSAQYASPAQRRARAGARDPMSALLAADAHGVIAGSLTASATRRARGSGRVSRRAGMRSPRGRGAMLLASISNFDVARPI